MTDIVPSEEVPNIDEDSGIAVIQSKVVMGEFLIMDENVVHHIWEFFEHVEVFFRRAINVALREVKFCGHGYKARIHDYR